MDAKALLLYRTDLETLRLTMAEGDRAALYLAIEKWCFGDDDYVVPNEFAFQTLIAKINQAEKRYHAYVSNGAKGGRPITKNNQSETKNNQDITKNNQSEPSHNLNNIKYKNNNNIKKEIQKKKDAVAEATDSLSEFNMFWDAYGKKVGRPNALRAFITARKDKSWTGIEAVLEAVRKWNNTEDWQKDGGKYKPHPATWLHRQGWLDECESTKSAQPEPAPLLLTTCRVVDC